MTTAKKITAAKKLPAARTPARKVAAPSAVRPAKTARSTIKPITQAVVASAPIAQPAAKPAPQEPAKVKKPKLVRDSFTIPKAEYLVLEELKQRAARMSSPAKKSELLRAGIKALAAMSDAALLAALQVVPAIKTGRPGSN